MTSLVRHSGRSYGFLSTKLGREIRYESSFSPKGDSLAVLFPKQSVCSTTTKELSVSHLQLILSKGEKRSLFSLIEVSVSLT